MDRPSAHKRMLWHYASAPDGNVVETGRTTLTGKRGHQRLTLALGFGSGSAGAVSAARGSLSDGFGSARHPLRPRLALLRQLAQCAPRAA